MGLTDFNFVNTLLFPAPEPTYNASNFPGELIWIPKTLDPKSAKPEECVPSLLLPAASARFIVLYLHSNAEDLGRCHGFCSLLRLQFQVHVLAVEYPGYGICPGGPACEQSVIDNAFLALRFIREVLKWPQEEIIVFGRSIGTGPALALAAHRQLYGVVLICPFLSVRALCRDFVGPVADLIEERFDNKERIGHVICPMLLVHGKQDFVVPWQHGLQLYEACRAKKRLVLPDQMNHNTNLHVDASYFVLPMLQFFGLPDYSFEQLTIPPWIYNKHLSPSYREGETEAPPAYGAAPEVWRCERGAEAAFQQAVHPPIKVHAEPAQPWIEDKSPDSPRWSIAEDASPRRKASSPHLEDCLDEKANFDDEELPALPEEVGFHKVPRTRSQGPQLLEDVVSDPWGFAVWTSPKSREKMAQPKALVRANEGVPASPWLPWWCGMAAPSATATSAPRPSWLDSRTPEPKMSRRQGPDLNINSAVPVKPVEVPEEPSLAVRRQMLGMQTRKGALKI